MWAIKIHKMLKINTLRTFFRSILGARTALFAVLSLTLLACSDEKKADKAGDCAPLPALQYAKNLKIGESCGERRAEIRSIVGRDTLVRRFSLEKAPARVVALSSAQIGYLLKLGLGDRIVGVGEGKYIADSALYTRVQKGEVAEVGSGPTLSLEKLMALKPDLVMNFATGGGYDDYERIEALGLPLEGLFLPDPRNEGCVQPRILPESAGLPKWQQDSFGAIYNDFFYHRNDELWRRNAEKKLPELLDATGMLACGEDLGMVPDCVPGVMEHESILSLEMANMDKGRPWPTLAVCATSSHDMATLRMQFAEENGRDMEPWEVRRVLWDHLSSQPMLAIFPLQDWVALDGKLRRKDYQNERINQPADPAHHWRYRMHFDAADLLDAKGLKTEITGLLKDSGRYNGNN